MKLHRVWPSSWLECGSDRSPQHWASPWTWDATTASHGYLPHCQGHLWSTGWEDRGQKQPPCMVLSAGSQEPQGGGPGVGVLQCVLRGLWYQDRAIHLFPCM